jgi:putative membrane protein
MYFNEGNFIGGMHGLWWFFWVALVGVIAFYGWGKPSEKRRAPRETPQEILRRRLASGEISTTQYEERKTLLDRDSAGKA